MIKDVITRDTASRLVDELRIRIDDTIDFIEKRVNETEGLTLVTDSTNYCDIVNLSEVLSEINKSDVYVVDGHYCTRTYSLKNRISSLSRVPVELRNSGTWVKVSSSEDSSKNDYQCSECQFKTPDNEYSFCPICGSKMQNAR